MTTHRLMFQGREIKISSEHCRQGGHGATGAPPLRRIAATALLAAMIHPAPTQATPTGLNNIPTADTPADREIVFQAFAVLGDERNTDWVLGFKGGLRPWNQRIEYGADGRVGEGSPTSLVLQLKYAIAFSDILDSDKNLPVMAAGVANAGVTGDIRDDVDQPIAYLVVTQDFDWFRGTVGYQFQPENDAAFFGFDKTFELFDRDFQFRTDFIQIDDEDQWLGSAGFIYSIHEHFAFESWVSVPFEHGEPFFIMKINLIFSF